MAASLSIVTGASSLSSEKATCSSTAPTRAGTSAGVTFSVPAAVVITFVIAFAVVTMCLAAATLRRRTP